MDLFELSIGCDRRRFLAHIVKGAALLLVQGCSGLSTLHLASLSANPPPTSPANSPCSGPAPAKQQTAKGSAAPGAEKIVTHEVAPMETIPRLARMYGVPEEQLTRANGLKPGEALIPGQRLLIPHPSQYKNIVPVYRNDRWQYILVHHTAGTVGKALLVDRIHRERGFEEGLGYHFLIDNGSLGKGNGQVEVAPRWIRQEQGAHCRASDMNHKSIGIGLVGNFNNKKPAAAQLHTLTQLAGMLGAYYEIPVANVLPHRLVPGAKTDCPGNLFPWRKFQLSLKKAMASPYC